MAGRRGFLKALAGAPALVAATLEAKPEIPKAPPFQPHQVWLIKSASANFTTGRRDPEMIWLKSYQDQVDFCKAEGLINPNTSVSFNALGEMVINPKPDSGPLVLHNDQKNAPRENAERSQANMKRLLERANAI